MLASLWVALEGVSVGLVSAAPQQTSATTEQALTQAEQLNQQAIDLYQLGRYSEAEQLYRLALAIREAQLGPDHLLTAQSLSNLASLYSSMGRYSEAENLYQRALAIREAQLGTDHSLTAQSLNDLALLYASMGRYEEAEQLYVRSLAINTSQFGPNHINTAASLNNLAELYRATGRYEEAEPLYLQILAISEQQFGPDHPDTVTSLNNLATLYWAQEKYPQALSALQQGLMIEETVLTRNLMLGDEANKRDYLRTFHGSSSAVISLHLNYLDENQQAAETSLTTILQRKGRILDLFTRRQYTLREQLGTKGQALQDELSNTQDKLSALVSNPPESLSSEEIQQQVTKLQRQIADLADQLSRYSAQLQPMEQPISLSSVQTLLPVNGALLEFVQYQEFDARAASGTGMGENHYAVYVLKPDGEIWGIDLGPASEIDALAEDFRTALSSPSTPLLQVQETSDELAARILSPIREHLDNTEHLLIAPDSVLSLIPFETLMVGSNRYLVQDYQISYLTSGRDLVRLQNQIAISQQPPVLVADPFLSNTVLELDTIASSFPESQVWLGSQSNEAHLKQINQPSILHIATHGFFDETSSEITNPLLRSGLMLTDVRSNQVGSEEDSILTALEVTGLNLHGTQLVVFSADESGLGEVTLGEGLYGFRRACIMAGARSQMMSLWKISDEVTRDMMDAYYKRLRQGEGRSQALRSVQIEMLNYENTAHPSYWAPFTLSGDWETLQ